jgi:hypothetical protein
LARLVPSDPLQDFRMLLEKALDLAFDNGADDFLQAIHGEDR